jgi:hypothetical protein
MPIRVTRTYVGFIRNYRQVCDGLDSFGDPASEIWNVTMDSRPNLRRYRRSSIVAFETLRN